MAVDIDVLHESHHEAWVCAQTLDSANIHGAVVQELSVATTPPPHLIKASVIPKEDTSTLASLSAPPPDGFVLTGTIDLFGFEELRTDFYSHHAPPPSELKLPKHVPPVHQLAVVRGAIHASKFFPEFAGTEFDIIKLQNVHVTYQNYSLDPTKPPGWCIGASMTFDQEYCIVHDLLGHVLGVENPRLDITCRLSAADWHKPLAVSSFVLEGVFADIHSVPCKGVAFTRVGVRLLGYNALMHHNGTMKMKKAYGFGVFGQLHLDVPGRTIPLELDFDMTQAGGLFQLYASLKADWDHAFGVPNLTLKQVALSVFLTTDHPWDSLTFAVEASLDLGVSKIFLEGMLSMSGSFYISASLRNLSWDQICAIYKHLFGTDLASPDFPILIGSITLSISSEEGLCLDLHGLQVGTYAAVDGKLTMRSNGAFLRAALSDGKIELDKDMGLVIEEAYVEASFSCKEGAKDASLMVGGKFHWEQYTVLVGAHLYKIEKDDQLHYTIYGAFADTEGGGGFRIADHIPGIEDTCLKDITISGAAMIVASRDDADLAAISHSPYPVRKGTLLTFSLFTWLTFATQLAGVQICAAVSGCGPANKLVKGNTDPNLFLSLAWSGGREIDISIQYASPICLDLGKGVITDPISLHVVLGTLPKLKVHTGAKIPVNGCTQPLHFMIEVELDEIGGTLTGQLAAPGGWRNPFDISPKLTVGPDLYLSASFLYAGVPSGLGFVGGLQVGKVTGQVALKISEKPTEQLFSVEVGDIDLLDIVALTRTVIDSDIADHVDVDVNIQKSGAKLTGCIDNFTLGPLTVSGFKKPKPFFEIEISSKRQGGEIDGQIEFLGIRTSLSCHFELTPKFIFEFDFELDFLGLFQFKVHAGPLPKKGEFKQIEPAYSSKSTCSLMTSSASSFAERYLPDDYLLTASFHSGGRKKLAQQLDSLFQKMAREEREATATTQKKLDEERRQWEEKVNAAQAQLDEAHKAWEAKHDQAHDNYAAKERETRADVDRLRARLDEATRQLHESISHEQAKLWAAQHDREVQINRDEENLRQTRREWDEKLHDAHRELDDATRELHSRFGHAQQDIDDAIAKVNSLNGEINWIRWKISDCHDASMWDFPKKAAIPGLCIELAALEVSREAAERALTFAKWVIQGSEFVTCEGAMGLAQESVELAEVGSHAAIEAAVGTLELTKKATHEAVELAEAGLEGVKRLGEEAVNLAKGALDAGEAVALEVMRDAQAIVDALESCAEKIEYETKRLALETVKATGSGAIHLAKAGVAIGHEVAEMGRSIAHWVAEFFVNMIVITEVELSLELGKAVGGFAFDAYVKGSIKDEEFEFQMHFDPRSVEQWISSLFEK
ncbi:hypothetical protein H0H81_008507 [Sphagnurus paluster]|uniref:Uncharacterized protein n=1 Tax=Sphagnurus paluster TaxID=117069 RepID=A0A9P7KGG3_9AGAR|nr:hypothetical protein H0H81_008507 [Sphagnurus paluster]